jgi:hypothetical protein
MGDTHTHVRPEPIEAPEPQPVTARDLVRSRALQAGYRALCAEGPAVISYASFVAGVDAFELYRAAHDSKGRAL